MSTSSDYSSLVTYITVQGAARAIDFYAKAFGARERCRLTTKGTDQIGHAELLLGDQVLMVADEFPGMSTGPKTLGGTTATLILMVPNCDEAHRRAVQAGATSTMEPTDMFYGFRSSSVTDPFGHKWMLQHFMTDVPHDEMQRRWDEMVSRHCPGGA